MRPRIVMPRCDGCGGYPARTLTYGYFDKAAKTHRQFRLCPRGTHQHVARQHCIERLNEKIFMGEGTERRAGASEQF